MIIAMGLPGAGKTTVLKSLKTDYEIHNFGDLMFEIEKENEFLFLDHPPPCQPLFTFKCQITRMRV